jgi:hypothetical protein
MIVLPYPSKLFILRYISVVLAIFTLFIIDSPIYYRIPFNIPIELYSRGIGETESGDGKTFRWFATDAAITFFGLDNATHMLVMNLHNDLLQRQLTIQVNDTPVVHYNVRPSWQKIYLLIPKTQITSYIDTLALRIPTLSPDTDPSFGLAVSELAIHQIDKGTLSLFVIFALLAIAFSIDLLGYLTKLTATDRTWAVWMGVLASGFILANWRLQAVVLLPIWLFMTLIAICITALLQWCTSRWQSWSPWFARVLMLSMMLFVLHATTLNAPAFVDIDHRARANHVLQIAAGNAAAVQARLSNQYEWGISSVPYSLLSYYFFVPLATFLPSTLSMTTGLKIVVSLINATIPSLLYGLMVNASYSQRAGFLASALCIGLPVQHIYFHDGSYPTIIGLWFTVLTIFVIQVFERRSAWSWIGFLIVTALIVISLLIYVMHIVFLPVVLGVAALIAYAHPVLRPTSYRLFLVVGISIIIAILLYYGQFILPTVSAVIDRLQASTRVGHDSLPSPLVGSFLEQVWGHTRSLPVVLLPIGLFLMFRKGATIHLAMMSGYVVLLIISCLVDTQFSLWNKHWYFCLPALAILPAIVLDSFVQQGFAGRVITAILVAFLLWESTLAWLLRAMIYEWSLRTL